MLARIGVVLSLLCALLSGAVAHADRPAAQLEYQRGAGTESCPSESVFRELVASRLGHDPFDGSGSRVFTIELSRAGRSVFLSIRDADEGGERILRGTLARCEDVVSSAALAVAMSIDPLAASGVAPAPEPEVPEPEQAEVPEVEVPETIAVPEPLPEPTEEPPVEEAEPFPLSFHIDVHSSFFQLPEPALGGALGFGLESGMLGLELEARVLGSVIEHITNLHDSIESWFYAGAIRGCLQIEAFSGCGGLVLGALQGISNTVSTPSTTLTFYSAFEVRLGVVLAISQYFDFRAHADLAIPFIENEFRIDEMAVWSSEPVSFGLSAGLGIRVP